MTAGSDTASRSWTVRLRDRLGRTVPAGQLLPDRQPAYVRSWIYVFGVACLAALIYVLASGVVLTIKGPAWWHENSVGHFVNSTHLWSVELFFFFMVIHLWGKFFMAAWRGGRALTWITGAVAFIASIGTAFTGYLVQSNFDSQWISTQAKDGLNSVGIGSEFNVLNTGQMLLWHVMTLPLVLGVLIVLHVILVRRHGVVPPFGAVPPAAATHAAHADDTHHAVLNDEAAFNEEPRQPLPPATEPASAGSGPFDAGDEPTHAPLSLQAPNDSPRSTGGQP